MRQKTRKNRHGNKCRINLFRIRFVQIVVHCCNTAAQRAQLWRRLIDLPSALPSLTLSLSHSLTLTCYTLPPVEMAFFDSSNVIIQGGTFNLNSAQGDLNINNRDPEFGMHDFMSVPKSLSITLWRTSYLETRSLSWSDSWLVWTLPAAKLSSRYPQSRSTDYLRLDPQRKFGIFFFLALRTCWCR